MTSLLWLPEAIDDITRLHAFLESKDKQAAARAVLCILDGAKILKESPRIGRPMPDETGRRELFIPFGASAYVLRYKLQDQNTAVVIRVWHSRERRDNID